MPIKVSIIEDDDWIRENLAAQIGQTSGFSCIGCYRDGEQALLSMGKEAPDVVMMDINLPKMSGIDCVRQLKGRLPHTQYVMLTVYEDADVIFKSLLAGAVGYLLKGRTGSGAQVLEAYPKDVAGPLAASSVYTGTAGMFAAVGFEEVARRHPERPIMRLRLG